MTTPDLWQPLPQAGEHPVFREDYSLTLLADGPTPWGYLRVVPTMQPDERSVEWSLDGSTMATLRMTDLAFGRKRLGKADYPVVIDPAHPAALTVGGVAGSAELVEGARSGLLRKRSAHIAIAIGSHRWTGGTEKNWYQVSADGGATARVRAHAVQDATRPSSDRTDDWRNAHLLTWTDGATLAQIAVAHLLFSGSNWAVVTSAPNRAMVDGARQSYFAERNHLLDER